MVTEKKDLPTKGSRLLRTGRWSFPGYSYFITASTYNHLPIFEDAIYCEIVFDSIDWLEREKGAQFYCSVIMPNHIHLVVEPGPEQMLSQLMQSLKGYTARKINILRGQKGHVWQDQYHDHLIRNEADLSNIICTAMIILLEEALCRMLGIILSGDASFLLNRIKLC